MAKLYFKNSTMGAGKTYDLLRVAYNYEIENKLHILICKPVIDTKGEDYIISRTGSKRKCDLLINEDMDLFETLKLLNLEEKIDAVLIDESQFLKRKQVEQLAAVTIKLDIPVICYGLRTDFNNQLFEGSNALFCYANFDPPKDLIAVNKEGKKCTHNLRLRNGKPYFGGSQIEIGENESYKPVTLKEWMEAKEEYERNIKK